MPLRVIRGMLEDDPERAAALVELEDRVIERALAMAESGRISKAEVRRTYEMPANVLDRMEDLGLLSPTSRGYTPDEVAIIKAIARFRAGGYDESIGFTVHDAVRFREALEPLVADEVGTLVARLADRVDTDRAVEIIAAGAEPLRELIGALHSKLLIDALRRARSEAP
jgi:hypothetical protein